MLVESSPYFADIALSIFPFGYIVAVCNFMRTNKIGAYSQVSRKIFILLNGEIFVRFISVGKINVKLFLCNFL